jgi:glycosyltransferase involved in cell wall biosynthesis
MPEPLISVLMSVRNGLPYVEQTVGSILAQTIRDWEFIIVDNASTDGSADAIERISKTEPRITLIGSHASTLMTSRCLTASSASSSSCATTRT